MLTKIIAASIALGVLIFVHELGHFIAAKINGVRVDKFYLGFDFAGLRLFGYRGATTEYGIGLIPLGGYVRLAGELPEDEVLSGAKPPPPPAQDELLAKSPFQRFTIFLAGPAMNVALAVLLTVVLALAGIPEPRYLSAAPQVTWIEPDSPAATAGLAGDDLIRAVNGVPIIDWRGFREQLATALAQQPSPAAVPISAERGGQLLPLLLPVPPSTDGQTPPEWSGYLGIGQPVETIFSTIDVGAARDAGLQPGDHLRSVNGEEIRSLDQFLHIMKLLNRSLEGREPENGETAPALQFVVQREGRELPLAVAPRYNASLKKFWLGVGFETPMVNVRHGFAEAVSLAVSDTWFLTKRTFETFGRLIIGRESLKSLAGPIGIVQIAGQAASSGLSTFLTFLAFLSLQLGIINLLPIPILDGGHLMFLLPEFFTKRQVSWRVRLMASQIGFGLLMALFALILVNDLIRIAF